MTWLGDVISLAIPGLLSKKNREKNMEITRIDISKYREGFQKHLIGFRNDWMRDKCWVSNDLTIACIAIEYAVGCAMLAGINCDESGKLTATVDDIAKMVFCFAGEDALDDDTVWIKAGKYSETQL